ncbi:MAG: GntR family transcriptional regulator [Dehalococcoidia bacterium]
MDDRPDTKAEFVAKRLRDSILRGQLKPGDWIRVDDLAQRLGVSRTPVREALRSLAAEGVVSIQPHVGATVTSHSLEDFVDGYYIRGVLEGLAAELATRWKSVDARSTFVDRLRGLSERTGEFLDEPTKFNQLSKRWHLEIAAAAQSSELYRVIQAYWKSQPFHSMELGRDQLQGVLDQHDAVNDCIAEGDPESASRAMRAHMESAAATIAGSLGVDLLDGRNRTASFRGRRESGATGLLNEADGFARGVRMEGE